MLPLDVGCDESVQACVTAVQQQTERIDILINNAGYVLAGAVEEASLEQAKRLFETNFFGTLRMVKAVLPTMRRQGEGQIINIGSLVALTPIPFWGLYNASKSAIDGLSDSLRQDLLPLNIRVSVVEPGFFSSDLGSNTQVGVETISDYDEWRTRTFQRHREEEESAPDLHIVAETVWKVINSKSPRLRYLVGKQVIYYKLGRVMTPGLEEKGRRMALAIVLFHLGRFDWNAPITYGFFGLVVPMVLLTVWYLFHPQAIIPLTDDGPVARAAKWWLWGTAVLMAAWGLALFLTDSGPAALIWVWPGDLLTSRLIAVMLWTLCAGALFSLRSRAALDVTLAVMIVYGVGVVAANVWNPTAVKSLYTALFALLAGGSTILLIQSGRTKS